MRERGKRVRDQASCFRCLHTEQASKPVSDNDDLAVTCLLCLFCTNAIAAVQSLRIAKSSRAFEKSQTVCFGHVAIYEENLLLF